MALDGPEASILDEGLFHLVDPVIGSIVYGLDKIENLFHSEDGLTFCQLILKDQRIRGVVEAFYERSSVALMKVYGARQDTAFTFMTNKVTGRINQGKHKVRVLLVHFLPRDSVVVFYKGSHLHKLVTKMGNIGLLEVAEESLQGEGIEPVEIITKEGGFAIIDVRLAFRIVRGVTFVIGFAAEEESEGWVKMKIPRDEKLKAMIEGMKSEKIGMNVVYFDPKPKNEIVKESS